MEQDFAYDRTFLNEDFTNSPKAVATLGPALKEGGMVRAGSILQVQAIKNISVPRRNQEDTRIHYDPRKHMLKLTVTDGITTGLALLAESHPNISDTTLPGTKLRVQRPIGFHSGILPFSSSNIEVLGGQVEPLIKQWNMQRTLELSRGWGSEITPLGGEVPPPWREFGQAVNIQSKKELASFKAMALVRESQSGIQTGENPTSTFEALRQETIAGLVPKTADKKLFAEGKQLLNKDILAITSEGFTEDEARMTLRRYKNNRAAALKFLIERRDGTRQEKRRAQPFKPKYGDDDSEPEPEVDPTHQPSNNITLFGFIKPVIPKDELKAQDDYSESFDLNLQGLKLNSSRYEQEERGGDAGRYRGRGSFGRGGGRRGGGRGRSGGRREGGRDYPAAQAMPPEKPIYEQYRGRPADFPSVNEASFAATIPSSTRNNGNSNLFQQFQAPTNVSSSRRWQGDSNIHAEYGQERADKQSRQTYHPFEQTHREQHYRESANQGYNQDFGGPPASGYSRTFVSSRYQQQDRGPPQMSARPNQTNPTDRMYR